jgi:hypothetical protein
MLGGFTATFTAEPDFANDKATYASKPYSGTEPSSTGD